MSEDYCPDATTLFVQMCDPECSCQTVWLVLHDAKAGEALARAALSPQVAREVAGDLLRMADQAEAQHLKSAGRLT